MYRTVFLSLIFSFHFALGDAVDDNIKKLESLRDTMSTEFKPVIQAQTEHMVLSHFSLRSADHLALSQAIVHQVSIRQAKIKKLALELEVLKSNYIDDKSLSDELLTQAYWIYSCLLYTSPSPRDATLSRMPSSA